MLFLYFPRLAEEVQQKNGTIRSLRKQLRQALAANNNNGSSKSKSNNAESSLGERRSRIDTKLVFDHTQSTTTGAKQSTDGGMDNVDSTRLNDPYSHGGFERTDNGRETLGTDGSNNAQVRTTDTHTHQWVRDRTETNHLRTKLRETERLAETLKTELEIYRKVIDSSRHGSDVESSSEYGGGGGGSGGQNGGDALQEHLEEIRALRKVLEESISVNDALRARLEAKLAAGDHRGGESEGRVGFFLTKRPLITLICQTSKDHQHSPPIH